MQRPIYACSCTLCGGKTAPGDDSLADASPWLAPAPSQPVLSYPYTGDYRIDALLPGAGTATGLGALPFRWNVDSGFGSPVSVTYSFMSAAPSYGGNQFGVGNTGFSPFTPQEKAAVRQIMARLQTEVGIALVEVEDSASSYGQVRLGNNWQQSSSGYTWLPYSTGDDRGGDVWIDQTVAVASTAPGSLGWATLVHEIGHALGLKHPGNYNAGSSPSTEPGNWLGAAEDNTNYTIMSYRPDTQAGQQRDWFGMYDLLALKALYGSGAPQAGDTYHRYDNSAGEVLGIIDDAGGFDTLDMSAVTHASAVDLRPGGFSSVGFHGNAGAVNNLSVSLSTVIERFIGTAFGDLAMGNDAANQFFLGGGINAADGTAGIDMALYAAPRAAHEVIAGGGTVRVTGPGLSDTLVNVERLTFADQNVAVDLEGAAGMTARILGAVFGREAPLERPDYVGIGLSLLDSGMSYEQLMRVALNARQIGPGTDHATLVDVLYRNVVGTEPAQDELAMFTGWLDNGICTEEQLGVFAAERPLNAVNIDLVGLALHGLAYV